MRKTIFKQFRLRVTAIIVFSMMAVILLSAILIYNFTFKSQFEDLRSRLKGIAYTAAININAVQLAQIGI